MKSASARLPQPASMRLGYFLSDFFEEDGSCIDPQHLHQDENAFFWLFSIKFFRLRDMLAERKRMRAVQIPSQRAAFQAPNTISGCDLCNSCIRPCVVQEES